MTHSTEDLCRSEASHVVAQLAAQSSGELSREDEGVRRFGVYKGGMLGFLMFFFFKRSFLSFLFLFFFVAFGCYTDCQVLFVGPKDLDLRLFLAGRAVGQNQPVPFW